MKSISTSEVSGNQRTERTPSLSSYDQAARRKDDSMGERKHRPMVAKVRDSLNGLREAWCNDSAVRHQLIFTGIAVTALLLAQPPVAWSLSCLILLVIGLVAEFINGAIEALLDRLHPLPHPAVRAAKDMASAAAFIVNVVASVVLLAALEICLAPALS
jgi:diacylglycerol kinase (ATP)